MPLSVHEPVQEYSVEPELSVRGPRRVRVTTWLAALVSGCASIYVLALLCASLIAARSAQLLWLAHSGSYGVAWVTDCRYADGSVGACVLDSRRSVIRLDYRVEGHDALTGSTLLSALGSQAAVPSNTGLSDDAEVLPATELRPHSVSIPTEFAVKYGSWNGNLVCAPANAVSEPSSLLSIIVAILLGAVSTALFVRFGRWLKRLIDVLRYGDAVVGTLTHKEIKESDLPTYFITYGFLDADGAPRQRLERCTPEQWRRLEIGEPVTVLYPPGQPSRCELYRHLPLRCA